MVFFFIITSLNSFLAIKMIKKESAKMEAKKIKKIDETTLANAMRLMFKNIQSGKTVYLAFSRNSFHILIFVMGMSVVANIALIDLLMRAPTIVERVNTFLYAAQFILSITAILGGLWLFLKGINIVTEK